MYAVVLLAAVEDSEVEVLVEVVVAVVSVEVSVVVVVILVVVAVVVDVIVEIVDIVVVDTLGSTPVNCLPDVSGDSVRGELMISLAVISTTTRSARNNRQLSTLHELFLSPALSMLILSRSMSLVFSAFVGETLG